VTLNSCALNWTSRAPAPERNAGLALIPAVFHYAKYRRLESRRFSFVGILDIELE
jgi:hypothetical protein